MNIQVYRTCVLCNKGIQADDGFVGNQNRQGWTFAHTLCREVIIMEQQYAVLKAIQEIGYNIRRKK